MAEDSETRWQAPLKVPAIEVVDLLSDDSGDLPPLASVIEGKRDASEAESESGDDSQWDESQWSLYEDAILGDDSVELVYGSKSASTLLSLSEN